MNAVDMTIDSPAVWKGPELDWTNEGLHLLADADRLDALAGLPLADLTRGVIIDTGSRPGAVSLAELAGSQVVPVGVRPGVGYCRDELR